MAEYVRRPPDQNSPKSSPRGSRSPAVIRQDSTGTLRTTITLGKNPTVIPSGPFYLMKEPPAQSDTTGATNLMQHHGLEHSYNKMTVKKVKEPLSAFLPNLPGNIDTPGHQDNSLLRGLIEKPPICGKEILPLTQMAGFRLHPGPLPEQYRLMSHQPQKKKKHKKHKREYKPGDTPSHEDNMSDAAHERKHKKQKRHDDDKEKRKKKKEKKKKKQKHSPDHPTLGSTNGATSKMS
ncbi:PREDICTED: mediator of RNA polymerase II transcription subunit 19-like [Priapulus caudatus]|uniref:Mediator of RNA polymerase II transcription subunit 19 n=1 Tax=Priapulus caudatus TaxID=37621 RepID=A0ABM1DWC1_PRICU|nr:PREDICTED: mediator of RNA polymerase II transcription subunit 19-like [Priapulus caudatus]